MIVSRKRDEPCTIDFTIKDREDGWFLVVGDVIRVDDDNLVDFSFSYAYNDRSVAERVVERMKEELSLIENPTTVNTRGIRPWRFVMVTPHLSSGE